MMMMVVVGDEEEKLNLCQIVRGKAPKLCDKATI